MNSDYAHGFGGRFGVQEDRMDKSAHKFEEEQNIVSTNYERTTPEVDGSYTNFFFHSLVNNDFVI